MADEETIEAPPVAEETPDEGPGPGPMLSDADRKRLAGVILKMQTDKAPPDKIKLVVDAFTKKYAGTSTEQPATAQLPAQPNYAQVPQQKPAGEDAPSTMSQTERSLGLDVSQDPAIVARRQHYDAMRQQAVQEVEGTDWKDKIFQGKTPALTTDPGMPQSAFQKIDTKALERYLDTKGLSNPDRYWMRNQLINYAHQRQAQYFVDKRAQEHLADIPQVKEAQDAANQAVMTGQIKPEQYDATWKAAVAAHPVGQNELNSAYAKAGQEYEAHQQDAIATRLNNIGLDEKPLRDNTPFHDQITGANKALMGAINFAGDIGTQLSSLLELGNIPGLSTLGYKMKTNADELKDKYQIPQNGELGNVLAGEILPQALDAIVLAKMAGAAGRPIYQSLANARATGAMGQFAEGALGGLAISPANSYLMAHQYYNQLVQKGEDPTTAGAKSDQFLVKNIATDMLMTPVQMGLMKIGGGSWAKKALTYAAEAGVAGTQLTAQDFNQKSIDNPAMSAMDYLSKDPDAKKTFVQGAVIGLLQKGAMDQMHKWDVNSDSKSAFKYSRMYGTDDRNTLYSNKTIAGNILSLTEMKDSPGRAQELHDITDAMQKSGVYNDQEAARLHGIINDVAAVREQVPKYGRAETRLAVMNELLNKRAAESFIEGGGDVGAAHLKDKLKESDERILRIMDGKEPLYFINGSETNKEQLLDAFEKNPEELTGKGVKIKVINDSETNKTIQDAIQEQKRGTNDVRNASGDSQAVGRRDEKEGAVHQDAPGEEGAPGPQASTHILEARHANTPNDEAGIVDDRNQVGLSDEGVIRAHDLKDEVQQNHAITKVVTSSLQRSKETGEIVADGKVPLESRAGLDSWDLKDFGHVTDAAFDHIKGWFAEHPHQKIYQGAIEQYQGKALGESLNEYAHRAIEARQQVEDEGPGPLVISHSNNMNIWEAYKENGNKWDKNAIEDYISRPSAEPGEIINTPEEHEKGQQVVEMIKAGHISDAELERGVKLFIQYEKEPSLAPPAIHEGNATETGDNETNAAPGRPIQNTGLQGPVPAPDEGTSAAHGNQSAQPVPVGASTADPTRLTKGAKQLITAGRTDDQIMAYLGRKGLDSETALAVLGEAKANPLNEQQKDASLQEVTKQYFDKEGNWLGSKELNKVNSQQTTREYQTEIKDSVKKDPAQKNVRWTDVDKAIHIYLDTQRNPGHFKEYYDKLSPEQKKIADLSQHLNERQLEVAQAIKEEYEVIGKQAMDEGLIKDVIDNYVARAWDFKGKPATEENFKFSTSTRHQLQRTLDTVLQGYAEGMKLKIEGATNNFQILKQEIGNVIENKRHLDQGLALKIDTGEKDAKGNPAKMTLFTTGKEPGYVQIESPTFRKWERSGNIKDYSAVDVQAFGRRRDVVVTEDGTVLKKEPVYAPEDVAKSLNNILGRGKLASIQGLINFNAAVKQSILSYSGFHFIAFTRAHVLSAKLSEAKGVNPRVAYKAGLSMLADQHPVGQALIKNGMTLNRQQDFMEGVTAHNTWVGKQMDKLAFTKAAKDKLLGLNTQFHKYLFNTYGAGLKMYDGINLAKAELIKKPNADPNEVYARVAKIMNDTYGGINWQRMHGTKMQDPTFRQISSLLLLAPDWTSSNLRFAKKAFERGDEGSLYRKSWARVILRGVALTAAANAALAFMDEEDDDGNPLTWAEAMQRRAGKAGDAGHLRSTMIDVTPLYRAIGGDPGKRAYFSIFGAYTDPIKMLAHPTDFLESKGSFITKSGLELLTSQNWQHKEFTTLDEFLGMDDKGKYAKGQTAHDKDDISPTTGLPYKKTQEGHDEGDERGGKMGGQLTKWPQGGAHPVTWGQAPSFVMSQVLGMMPTAAQNFWQIASGENDAVTGILNATGSNVLTNKEPKKKDE